MFYQQPLSYIYFLVLNNSMRFQSKLLPKLFFDKFCNKDSMSLFFVNQGKTKDTIFNINNSKIYLFNQNLN